MISIEEARALLPKVGDVRMEVPTIDEGGTKHIGVRKAQRCTVVYVNTAHLWYTVVFADGIRESYKVPKGKLGPWGGVSR